MEFGLGFWDRSLKLSTLFLEFVFKASLRTCSVSRLTVWAKGSRAKSGKLQKSL